MVMLLPAWSSVPLSLTTFEPRMRMSLPASSTTVLPPRLLPMTPVEPKVPCSMLRSLPQSPLSSVRRPALRAEVDWLASMVIDG